MKRFAIFLLVVVAVHVYLYQVDAADVDIQTTVTLGGDATWYQLVEHYWWHGLAILISPLAGFAAGQYVKMSCRPGRLRIALAAGGVTALFTAMLWPGTLAESAKMGLTIGTIQPFVVWAWFAVAARFAPKQLATLQGSNGDMTILPWVKVKKPGRREDGAPVDFPVVGEDDTEPRA